MSVIVHPGRLRQEIVRRGWDPIDLARDARLSSATVRAALSGRPIAARSLSLIVGALVRNPPIREIDQLILGGADVDVG